MRSGTGGGGEDESEIAWVLEEGIGNRVSKGVIAGGREIEYSFTRASRGGGGGEEEEEEEWKTRHRHCFTFFVEIVKQLNLVMPVMA